MNLGSVMSNIFGGQQQQQPAQPQPGNIPLSALQGTAAATSGGTAPNGVIPASTNATSGQESALDKFADLWNTQSNQTQDQPLFNVSQEKLLDIARKTDFKPQVSPDQLAAITAGGEGSIPALLEIINSAVQMGYARSAEASTRLIQGGLDKAGYAKSSELSGLIKQHTLSAGIREANPLLAHSAVAPIISALQDKLMLKNPNATPKEMQEQLNVYMSEFVNAVQAPQAALQSQQSSRTNKTEDWDKFFN